MSEVMKEERAVGLNVAELGIQPSQDVDVISSDPSGPSDPTDPKQTQADETPAQLPPFSITEPGLDLDLPNPHSETGPPFQLDPKTPRLSTDGVEKNDWEVVNASPSHSPSKDTDNQSQTTKVKGREREKSANSTFGKDGKIGQKIDGVKKVLKSGVFGNSSPKSPPTRTKVTTKPPVPSARPTIAKPAPRSSMAAATASTATSTKPVSTLNRSTTTTTTTAKPPLAASVSRPTPTTGTTSTVRPKPSTSTDKPSIGSKTTTNVPRPFGARASTTAATTIKPSPPYTVRSARSESITKATAASARRASIVSRGSNESADAGPAPAAATVTATSTKPRASMPMAKAASAGARGSMPPPVIPNRAMPPRSSVGPGNFNNHKESEDLKKKVAELEKELAAMKASREELSEKQKEEKAALIESHTKALDALTEEISAAEDKAKAELERQLEELQELRHRERGEMQHAHTTASKEMDTKLEEFLQTVKTLEEELAAGQVLVETQRKQLKETEESASNYRLELEDRRSQIGELIQTVADLRQNLADKEAEIKAANEQLTLLHTAQTTSRAEFGGLQDTVSRLTLELDSALQGRDVELAHQQRILTLEHEAQELAGQIQKFTDELAVTKIDLKTRTDELEASQATIAALKEASVKQDAIIADLETQRAEAQKKHDGLLIEAAQMSDTRISELSDERDRLATLNNELVAELDEERVKLSENNVKLQDCLKERNEDKIKIEVLATVIKSSEHELKQAQAAHKREYATVFAGAQALIIADHNQHVKNVQAKLEKTHAELMAAKGQEMFELEQTHNAAMAYLTTRHQDEVQDLSYRLGMMEAQAAEAAAEAERSRVSLKESERTIAILRKDLQGAVARAGSDKGSKEVLAQALRRNAELMDELEGTKTMAEMNKSRFEELLMVSEAGHAAALRQAKEAFEAELAEERGSSDSRRDGLQEELSRCRKELDMVRAEKSEVEHDRRNIIEQTRERHKTPEKTRSHRGTPGANESQAAEVSDASPKPIIDENRERQKTPEKTRPHKGIPGAYESQSEVSDTSPKAKSDKNTPRKSYKELDTDEPRSGPEIPWADFVKDEKYDQPAHPALDIPESPVQPALGRQDQGRDAVSAPIQPLPPQTPEAIKTPLLKKGKSEKHSSPQWWVHGPNTDSELSDWTKDKDSDVPIGSKSSRSETKSEATETKVEDSPETVTVRPSRATTVSEVKNPVTPDSKPLLTAVNEQLETVAAPSLTPPKSIAGSESPHSHPFGEELKQDQETPNAATFRKDLPVDDGPESPLTKKEA